MEEDPTKKTEKKEIVSLCGHCGKKRVGENWIEITTDERAQIEEEKAITHGICPDCLKKQLEDDE